MGHRKSKAKGSPRERTTLEKEALHEKAIEMLMGGKTCTEIALELGVTRAAVYLWASSAGLKRRAISQEAKYPTLLDYHLSLLRNGSQLEIMTDNTGRSWLKVQKNETLGGHIDTVIKASQVACWGIRRDDSSGAFLIPTYAYHFTLFRALENSNLSKLGAKVLGKISTPKKAESSRQNGRKGGRPKGGKKEVTKVIR